MQSKKRSVIAEMATHCCICYFLLVITSYLAPFSLQDIAQYWSNFCSRVGVPLFNTFLLSNRWEYHRISYIAVN